ncbi:PTS system transporter subunit IIA [Streptococcus pneumoniae]|nr:PTS system transporter subunit IIA [Streptococcus pneumoniae]
MVLDYFFDKNLVFCLEADNQEQLFDQVVNAESMQEFYAQSLLGFFEYASTHYYVANPTVSMLDNFLNGTKIVWDSYI